MTYEKRRDEKSWAGIRWDEVWGVKSAVWSVGVKSAVWSVKCEVWSVKSAVRKGVKSAVRSVECEAWSVDCEVWSLECEECSVKCEVWSLKSTVWSEVLTAKGAVWRAQCEVWRLSSVKCDVELQMWNKTPVSQSARTHGLRWRTAHASSIDEKGLIYIYIFKATSAPPRAGTTGKPYLKQPIRSLFSLSPAESSLRLLHENVILPWFLHHSPCSLSSFTLW